MNPREAMLTSIFNFPEEFRVTSNPRPRKGLFIGSINKCARYLLIAMKVPKQLNGINVVYLENVQMSSNADYIVSMGNEIENVMRRHLKYRKVPIHADQMQITELDGKIRGFLDFGVEVEGIGMIIIDAKGMSESVFARFTAAATLLDFKEDYFYQVLHYINSVKLEYGYIVGVNRSTGQVAVKEVSRAKYQDLYNKSMERSKKIIVTPIEEYHTLEAAPDNECTQCEFVSACRPEFYASLGVN